MQRQANLIAGEWRLGDGDIPSINPSDLADIVGSFAQASAADLDDAVAAARDAQRIWARTGLEARARVLDAIGRELVARADELGRLLSREEGKTLPEGIGEVTRAAQIFLFFSGECLRMAGEKTVRQLENDARIAAGRVDNLKAALDASKVTASDAGTGEVTLRGLEQQAKLLKDQLDFNTQKYQEAVARENAVSTP